MQYSPASSFPRSSPLSLPFVEFWPRLKQCRISGGAGCIVCPFESHNAYPGLTPFHYLLEGLISDVVHDQTVSCTTNEFARIIPPPGQTCQQWIGPYIDQIGGYLQDPLNSTVCEFCRFANGDQYVSEYSNTLTLGCLNRDVLLKSLERLRHIHVILPLIRTS
jgi:hypothetical protein